MSGSRPHVDPIEQRIMELPEPDLTDPDNPEWTEEDFARAEGPETMPPEVLAAFPKTREALARAGRPAGPAGPKQPVHIRLSPDILAAFKAGGRGWQTRMEQALREWLDAHPDAGQAG